jgi:Fur family transcriptional regulator, ferric uptake regulator
MLKSNLEKYRATLQTKGLKATTFRLQLMSLLTHTSHPLSAQEIRTKWKEGRIDSVTLYRALDALVEASLVRCVDLQHGHVDYEIIAGGEHHHHLVCTGCGTIEDFIGCPAETIEKLALKRSSTFASVKEHSFEFFGTCKTCSA